MIFHISFLIRCVCSDVFFASITYADVRKKGYVMKVRERFEKQNNSIRQLLKKLRRHDTIVVAISVFIALLLCGGLIYLSTPVVASTTVEEYQASNQESTQQTKEKLSEIKDYLTELDKLVCENKEGIDSIYETTSEIREINNKEVNNNEINTASDSSIIKSTITEKMIGLDKSVIEIHDSIEKTNERITEIERLISSESQDNKKEIADGFAGINEQLSVIKSQYSQIQENNRALADELKKTVNDGNTQISSSLSDKYTVLIDKLSDMDNKMTARSNETIDSFKSDLDVLNSELGGKIADLGTNLDNNFVSLNGSVDSGFQGVNSKVTALGDDMKSLDENMTTLSGSIDTKFGSLEENVSNYNDTVVNKLDSQSEKMTSDISGLKTLLESEIASVNSKIDQVFLSVSNGKSRLASALLTKGVTVDSDASFEDLGKAIESIEVMVPGEIEYVRHYHVDGKGEVVEGDQVPADRSGGCFTEADSHHHDNDTCYKKVTEYYYSTSKGVENRGEAYNLNGAVFYHFYCSYCNTSFDGENPSHIESTRDMDVIEQREGALSETKETKVLDCPYNGTADFYGLGCGLRNGEIVEAHIVYKNKDESNSEGNGD